MPQKVSHCKEGNNDRLYYSFTWEVPFNDIFTFILDQHYHPMQHQPSLRYQLPSRANHLRSGANSLDRNKFRFRVVACIVVLFLLQSVLEYKPSTQSGYIDVETKKSYDLLTLPSLLLASLRTLSLNLGGGKCKWVCLLMHKYPYQLNHFLDSTKLQTQLHRSNL